MTDIDSLREEASAAARRHAAAVTGQERAAGAAEAARTELQREFGVTTVADAKLLAAQLEQDLEAEAGRVRAALERTGAQ